MNSTLIINIFRFVSLLLLQVVLFDNIDLFGFVTPYPYILFILLYPLNSNRVGLILASFFLGLILDGFNNSGGVQAAACVSLAYFREPFLKFSFGISYEYHMIKITDKISTELLTYLGISILFHHLIFYSLEIFNIQFTLEILLRTVLSSVLTLVFIIILIFLTKPAKK